MRIIIVAGGTGGHVFPAIGLAQALKAGNIQILFIGTKRAIEDQVKKRGYDVETLPITVMSFKSIIQSFYSVAGLIGSFLKGFEIFWRVKPDVVVGFGGYVTGPILLAAKLMNIPTLIHEQNAIPGKANSLLAKFVNKITISFNRTKKYFKSDKVVLTGCPIREEFLDIEKEKALKFFDFDSNKFTILVMGGSLGSHAINQIFLETVSLFEERNKLQIIHICGNQDYEFFKQEYKKINIKSKVYGFFEEIGYAYKVADLVVSRAGASTITELMSFGLASILIPYPFASMHQMENAKVLVNSNAAVLIEEKNISASQLKNQIAGFIKNKEKIAILKDNIKKLNITGAAGNLAKEVLSLAKGKK